MKKNRQNISHWLSVIIIGIALGLALQFVRAWTEPTSFPPSGNVGAPINTGSQPQTREGGLLMGSATTGGNKGPGTLNADQLCIRGDCRTVWPTGGSSGGGGGGGGTTTPMYQCPNHSSLSDLNHTTCTGQIWGSSTCCTSVGDATSGADWCSDCMAV